MDDHPVTDPVIAIARALVASGAPGECACAAPAFRVREIATILAVDDSTVYRWIAKGLLRAYKFEDTIRVAREDFDAFRRRSVIRPLGDLEAAAQAAEAVA